MSERGKRSQTVICHEQVPLTLEQFKYYMESTGYWFETAKEETATKDSLKQIGFKKFFELDLERKRNETRNILA